MVFLALAGRNAVHRRRCGQRLVKADDGSGGVLRNHKATVQTRIGNEEARQVARTADELIGAALRDVSQLAHCYCEEVHRHCDRLAVEVAGRDNKVFVRTYCRIVSSRIHLYVNH